MCLHVYEGNMMHRVVLVSVSVRFIYVYFTDFFAICKEWINLNAVLWILAAYAVMYALRFYTYLYSYVGRYRYK